MISVIKKGTVTAAQIVFIGRPSALGNPFSHVAKSAAEVKVQTRDQAVSYHIEFMDAVLGRKSITQTPRAVQQFLQQLETSGTLASTRQAIRSELNRIYCLAKADAVALECYCEPLPCHGRHIKSLLEEALAQRGKR
jgi:hypothetical protein